MGNVARPFHRVNRAADVFWPTGSSAPMGDHPRCLPGSVDQRASNARATEDLGEGLASGGIPFCTQARRPGNRALTSCVNALPVEGNPSLDHVGIIRQPSGIFGQWQREAWLDALEVGTEALRETRAKRYEAGAAMRSGGSVWHKQRAQGQRDYFKKLRRCGTEFFGLGCLDCGHRENIGNKCDKYLLCPVCRSHRIKKYRARAINVFGNFERYAQKTGRLRGKRRGGRYTKKLLTLTVPHVGDTAQRIKLLQVAWVWFLRKLNEHFAALGCKDVIWLRAFEWTPGHDGKGHPHYHLILFSPFLPRLELGLWWHAALRRAGCPASEVACALIPDIQKVRKEHDVCEAIKYLTKDIDLNTALADVSVFLAVFESLYGKRLIQTSKGFFKYWESRFIYQCKACESPCVRIVDFGLPKALPCVCMKCFPVRGPPPPGKGMKRVGLTSDQVLAGQLIETCGGRLC